jgi:cytochrome bd-type quinol oxidase subunit 1
MDAVLLARVQFAFTVGYHFLFVPISLGSGVFMLMAGPGGGRELSELGPRSE